MDQVSRDLIQALLTHQHDYAAEEIWRIKKYSPRVYIFGAGAAGRLVKENLSNYGIYAFAFVDNNEKKVGGEYEGLPVVSFSSLRTDRNEKIIVIGTVAYHYEVVAQCLEGGIPPHQICYADFLHYSGEKTVENFFNQNIEHIVEIYGKCADALSKDLFITNLLYQLNRDRRYYPRNLISPLENQYYEPAIVNLSDSEVYFDCGAKDGDTAIAFHHACGGVYRKVLMFEPDAENYTLLKTNTAGLPNMIPVNAGVGRESTKLAFDGNKKGHSCFVESGGMTAEIVPLDNYSQEGPTLIKMDIEGFELQALEGARKILMEQKPKLAICVYHKPCDLVELPAYVLSQRADYKIYYRLYRGFGHDLVCYLV